MLEWRKYHMRYLSAKEADGQTLTKAQLGFDVEKG